MIGEADHSGSFVEHPLRLDNDALLAQCQVKTKRGSGPGGQHRNKTDTAVAITHLPTGVIAEASESRQQLDNRDKAIHRLRVEIALTVRRPIDEERMPSEVWRSRLKDGRLKVNELHRDFPIILSEALDMLNGRVGDWTIVCQKLEVTSSQMIKLLKLEPRAFQMVNQWRRTSGERPFH